MALMDNDKDILPLSSIAELLSTKVRTLKMYEDKELFPKKNTSTKKMYSINDVKIISFVHYLASVKKINSNGIQYILEMINENMDEKNKMKFLEIVESKMEQICGSEVKDVEVLE